MQQRPDNSGPFLLSLAIHAGFLASLWLVTMSCERFNGFVEKARLPVEWFALECARPVSVAGPVIEASLVNYTPKPQPRVKVPRTAPPVPKPTPAKPEPQPEVIEAKLPDAPVADDTKNQEKIDRLALEKAQAEREQEEKRKREQQLLDEQEQLVQMEKERQQQLDDIRKMREAAQKKREQEELKLAKLMEKQRQDAADEERAVTEPQAEQPEQQQAGNEGTDDDLRSRYVLALQTAVTNGWLRPETAQVGLRCTVRIVQIPGGEVLSATVISPCNGDDMTRRSIEAAVLRAQPLPYSGYEKVFARSIDFNFSYEGG
ncbi:MAG TPA: cell envelope integrity protein TolA [Xanthomonadales bacterium]|nr:cell envelope integrity protein TolA [Xanthomonadales bacterium]